MQTAAESVGVGVSGGCALEPRAGKATSARSRANIGASVLTLQRAAEVVTHVGVGVRIPVCVHTNIGYQRNVRTRCRCVTDTSELALPGSAKNLVRTLDDHDAQETS
jgi:hypothetical protein